MPCPFKPEVLGALLCSSETLSVCHLVYNNDGSVKSVRGQRRFGLNRSAISLSWRFLLLHTRSYILLPPRLIGAETEPLYSSVSAN